MKKKTNWLKLVLVAVVVAGIAVASIMYYLNAGDQRSVERPNQVRAFVFPILDLFIFLGVIGFVIVVLKSIIKSSLEETRYQPDARNLPPAISGPQGFPVVTAQAEVYIGGDGPGQYRVQGVHRQTKMDISKYIRADSAANAQVKAELEDIVVTSVTKVAL